MENGFEFQNWAKITPAVFEGGDWEELLLLSKHSIAIFCRLQFSPRSGRGFSKHCLTLGAFFSNKIHLQPASFSGLFLFA